MMSKIGLAAIAFAAHVVTISNVLAEEVLDWPAFDGVELNTVRVTDRVFMVQRPSGGGNVGVYIGDEGVLVVDSLFPSLGDKIVAEIRKLTDKDIRFLINTHVHPDHIGGNESFAQEGVIILAHDSVRRKALNRLRWPRDGGSFGPAPSPSARPFLTYSDAMSFHFEAEEVQAFLAPAAHTDGDTFVYFPHSNVLHLGDVFRTTSYPVIDVYNGGTLRGTIAALDLAIQIAEPDTKVIPGHGLNIAGVGELQEFRHMIATVRDRVLSMIDQGMNLDEIMLEAPTSDFDVRWGQEADWSSAEFLPIVYHELGGGARYDKAIRDPNSPSKLFQRASGAKKE